MNKEDEIARLKDENRDLKDEQFDTLCLQVSEIHECVQDLSTRTAKVEVYTKIGAWLFGVIYVAGITAILRLLIAPGFFSALAKTF